MSAFIRQTALALAFASFCVRSVIAADHTLDDSVNQMGQKLCRYLDAKGYAEISIRPFGGPPELQASAGPGLVQKFATVFQKHGVSVVDSAAIILTGDYTLVPSMEDQVTVRILGTLMDRTGDVLTDFTLADAHIPGHEQVHIQSDVNHAEDVVQLLGITTDLYPEDSAHDRNQDLKKHIEHPQVYISDSRCSASSRSPYHMQLMIGQSSLPLQEQGGKAFVALQRADVYTVRLHNDSEYDAAVKLCIDGLNVFTFSKLKNAQGQPQYSVYIIPAGKMIELKGWHRTNDVVDQFQVMKYADSAAATLGHTQDIGTITASFFAAWPKGGTRPHDEDFVSKGNGNATGFGPPVRQAAKEVKREIGRLRSSVSIRYAQ